MGTIKKGIMQNISEERYTLDPIHLHGNISKQKHRHASYIFPYQLMW